MVNLNKLTKLGWTVVLLLMCSIGTFAQAVDDVDAEDDIKPVVDVLAISIDDLNLSDLSLIYHVPDQNTDGDGRVAAVPVTAFEEAEDLNQVDSFDEELSTLDDDKLFTVNAYPNPAVNNLTLDFDRESFYEVNVYNLMGKLEETHFVENSAVYEMDVTQLLSGVYLFQIVSGDQVVTHKVKISH